MMARSDTMPTPEPLTRVKRAEHDRAGGFRRNARQDGLGLERPTAMFFAAAIVAMIAARAATIALEWSVF